MFSKHSQSLKVLMMLTVSMTVSHLCQNLEIVKGVNYCDKVISTPKPGEGASTE